MDPLTHALASLTLQRAAFPSLSRTATISVVICGIIADADLLSTYFGPSAYLAFDRTYCHSLPAALVFALLAPIPFFFLKPKSPETQIPRATIFAAAFAAALLHLALDVCQSSSVQLLWPFSSRRDPSPVARRSRHRRNWRPPQRPPRPHRRDPHAPRANPLPRRPFHAPR